MSENYLKAIQTSQGRKALEKKGDDGDHTAEDVHRHGRKRIAFRAGMTALLAAAGTGFGLLAINKQESVSAAQARADKAAFGKTIYGSQPEGAQGSKSQDGASQASAPEAGTTGSTESAAPSSGTEVTPTADTSIPAEGDWHPTPDAQPVQPAGSDTTGNAQEAGGGVDADQPPAGGVDAK